MAALSHQQIRALLHGPSPLVSGYLDLELQLQPNGMDLTLRSLDRFLDAGHLGKGNADRRLPATEQVAFGPTGSAYLSPGPYLATLNEVVHLPDGVMALGKPRSSLLRSGVAIHNAVWDAGYHGRSQALMVVYNTHGFTLARDARVLQLVFFTLDTPTATPYRGQFQQERL